MSPVHTDMFTGLFGMLELELGAAIMVNLARERSLKLSDLRVKKEDFTGRHFTGCERLRLTSRERGTNEGFHCSCGRGSDYARDAFRELVEHGWLQQTANGEYRLIHEFITRVARRVPGVVL